MRIPSMPTCSVLLWWILIPPCAAIEYLHPMLYLDLREDEVGCAASDLRLVSRVGHVWKVLSPIHVLFAMGKRRAQSVSVARFADSRDRVRCTTDGIGFQNAIAMHCHMTASGLPEFPEACRTAMRHFSPGFCKWYNVSKHGMLSSPRLEKQCGMALGVTTSIEFEIMGEADVDRMRPSITQAFSKYRRELHWVSMHNTVESRALRYRYGKFFSSQSDCLVSCCVECRRCTQHDQIDLLWLLRDLLPASKARQRRLFPTLPASNNVTLRLLNYGSGALEGTDPMTAIILDQRDWFVEGLCVDANPSRLVEAEEKIIEAGVHGMKVKHSILSADVAAITEIIDDSPALRHAPLDILKVDIDSIDLELTIATLRIIEQRSGADYLPLVVVIEFAPSIPPPFQVLTRDWRPMLSGRAMPLREGVLNSLSAIVAQLWPFGYRLHRLGYLDLVFVREAVAREENVQGFDAQDEFACYLNRDGVEAASELDQSFRWMTMQSLGAAQEELYAVLTEGLQRSRRTELSDAIPIDEPMPPFGSYGIEVGFAVPPSA